MRYHSSASRRIRRILIVEDHEDVRTELGEHFRDMGYQVETAADGNDGIARALRMNPDVIVLDLALPRLNGWDMIGLLRTYPSTKEIPLVTYSDREREDDADRALAARCDVVLDAPCTPEEIEEAVEGLLGLENPESEVG